MESAKAQSCEASEKHAKETKQPQSKPTPAAPDQVPSVSASTEAKPLSPVSEPTPANDPAPSTDPAPPQDPKPIKNQESKGDDPGQSAGPPPVVRQNSRRVPPGGHTSGGFW